jgi:hypothetical protein
MKATIVSTLPCRTGSPNRSTWPTSPDFSVCEVTAEIYMVPNTGESQSCHHFFNVVFRL